MKTSLIIILQLVLLNQLSAQAPSFTAIDADSLRFELASVIAVSPEKPDYLSRMAKLSGARFRLLYDEGYRISDAFDVSFTPTAQKLFVYNTVLKGKLKESHSDDSQRLPIPATYIIGQNGQIVWRHVDPNYKKRASVKQILEQLP